jgi:cold shock CspA family protein
MKAFTTELVEDVTKRLSARTPAPVQNVQAPKFHSTIKTYLDLRGFGFIHHSPEDVFFHVTNVPAHQRTSIITGAEVYFRIAKTPKGLEAKEIEIGQ